MGISLVYSCEYESVYQSSDTELAIQEVKVFNIQPGHFVSLPVEYLSYVTEIQTNYAPCTGTFDRDSRPQQVCFTCDCTAEVGTSHVLNLHGAWPGFVKAVPFTRQFIYNIVA